MEYFNIDGFPDYRLVRESERDFYAESCKRGEWGEIGSDIGDGHINIALYNKGVVKKTCLHTLVAEIFVPNPENKTVVHHIDFDPTNNDPSNLMWVTRNEHAEIHMKMNNPMKGRKGKNSPMYGKPKPEGSGLQPKPVESIDTDGVVVRYESIGKAERVTGVDRSSISRCCDGKPYYKTAGGYKWRYAD